MSTDQDKREIVAAILTSGLLQTIPTAVKTYYVPGFNRPLE
jgi:hypothetical protein